MRASTARGQSAETLIAIIIDQASGKALDKINDKVAKAVKKKIFQGNILGSLQNPKLLV